MIFFKISAKKKNLIFDLLELFNFYQEEQKILVDLLRILSKISEKEKVTHKICAYTNIENIIDNIFQKQKKNDYILSGTL